jgi:hypothetical protein
MVREQLIDILQFERIAMDMIAVARKKAERRMEEEGDSESVVGELEEEILGPLPTV